MLPNTKSIISLLALWLVSAPLVAQTIEACDEHEETCKPVTIESNSPVTKIPHDYAFGGEYRWFEIKEGYDAGKRLFYFDTVIGQPNSAEIDKISRTVLMVHGNPENSYTWNATIKSLAALPGKSRVIAMDHIGFGLSDQASFEMVDMHHSENLRQLIEYLDMQDITLLIHDWGGAIGIGALIDQPERVTSLVVVNSTVFPVPLEHEEGRNYATYPEQISLLGWADFPSLVPDSLWGATSATVIRLQPSESGIVLLADVLWKTAKYYFGFFPDEHGGALRVYRDQFDSSMNSRSSQRMVKQTPVWGHGWSYQDDTLGTQDNHSYYRNIQTKISTVWKGINVAGVFGGFDVLGQEIVLNQWRDALPQMSIDFHPNATHFIEEFKYEEIAQAIVNVSE